MKSFFFANHIIKTRRFIKKNLVVNNTERKRFLIITDSCPGLGPLSAWFHYTTLINFAKKNRFIPIIDFKNFFMPDFMDEQNFGKFNYWDVYFTQPTLRYSLEFAYKSNYLLFDYYKMQKSDDAKFIFSKYCIFKKSDTSYINLMEKKETKIASKYAELYSISEVIQNRARDYCKVNVPENEKILAVSCIRGHEWLHLIKSEWTPDGTHTRKVEVNELIADIEKALIRTGYNYFFFIVDDRETCECIKKHFGGRCLTYERALYHYFENGEPVILETMEKTLNKVNAEFNNIISPKQTRVMDYLTEVSIISSCDSLVTRGGASDTFAYLLKKGKYEYIL
ncbi:MAG: hypothetical protein VZQ47_05595 [Treponema sp.]|nr:hypothetical protein [Treponema sp.]MEE3435008.1 hypothetical protein [Treponema sp.]